MRKEKFLSWRLFANRISDKKHQAESDFGSKKSINNFFSFPDFSFDVSDPKKEEEEEAGIALRFAFQFLFYFSIWGKIGSSEAIFVCDSISIIISLHGWKKKQRIIAVILYSIIVRLNHKSMRFPSEKQKWIEFLLDTTQPNPPNGSERKSL